jgi:hypothetical protein
VAGSRVHGNKPFIYIKCWKFLSNLATDSFSTGTELHGVSQYTGRLIFVQRGASIYLTLTMA